MGTQGYALRASLGATSFEDALERVTAVLREEGFGVLTEIDVAKTLDAKLGVTVAPYRILGACNPELAHRALQHDPAMGVLLPCNVVVRQVDDAVEVLIVDPKAMFSVVDDPAVEPIAAEVGRRLQRVALALRAED